MEKTFTRLLEYLSDQSSSFAYLIIFGILVACGLGFPLPEDVPLIIAGYMCSQEDMEVPWALLVTIAGVLMGDTILFYLGRKMGMRFLGSTRVQMLFKKERVRR